MSAAEGSAGSHASAASPAAWRSSRAIFRPGHRRKTRAAQRTGVQPPHQHPRRRSHRHNNCGPRRQQQPCRHFVVAQRVLQIERQRHHRKHLGQIGADRRKHRHREDRNPQQVERQQRMRLAQLAPHEPPARRQEDGRSGQQYPTVPAVGKSFDRSHQQPERQRVERHVAPPGCAAVGLYGIGRQKPRAEPQRRRTHRNIDRKEPLPRPRRKDGGRHGRPRHRRHGYYRGIDSHPAPELGPRVDEAYQRRVDRRHGRRPEALEHPGQHQRRERPGQSTARRSQREERQAAHINLTVTQRLTQRGQRQHAHHDGQLVGVDNPYRIGRRHRQLRPQRRQRHIGYRAVQHREPHAERHGQHGTQPARHGQPVAGCSM